MERQLKIRGCTERKKLHYHSLLLSDRLPLSIGGGIGQSRLCMFFLRKKHIGEVQAGIWPFETLKESDKDDLKLI
jgi:aspartate--ammonia ligase